MLWPEKDRRMCLENLQITEVSLFHWINKIIAYYIIGTYRGKSCVQFWNIFRKKTCSVQSCIKLLTHLFLSLILSIKLRLKLWRPCTRPPGLCLPCLTIVTPCTGFIIGTLAQQRYRTYRLCLTDSLFYFIYFFFIQSAGSNTTQPICPKFPGMMDSESG